jgi:hypothetical protein
MLCRYFEAAHPDKALGWRQLLLLLCVRLLCSAAAAAGSALLARLPALRQLQCNRGALLIPPVTAASNSRVVMQAAVNLTVLPFSTE